MTSRQGHSEVTGSPSPKSKEDICELLGAANETTILIEGIESPALVDTGSMITSIGEDFYHKHLKADHLLLDVAPGINVEGAGGNQLPLLGVVEVRISCTGSSKEDLQVPVIVLPSTKYNQRIPAIIGTNVLSRIKDLPSLTGSLKDSAALVGEVHGCELDDVHLYSCGNVTLPPQKITVISARIGANRSFSVGVPTVVETLPGGVGMPQTLIQVDSKSRKVNVCLVNLTEREVHIPKLQKIATVQPARAIEVHTSSEQVKESCMPTSDSTAAATDSTQVQDVPVDLEDTDLTEDQRCQVKDLLRRYSDVFASSKMELGTAKGIKHGIKLTDPHPFKDRPRRIPPAYYKEVQQHIEEMLACGAIRRSKSPWCSNVVLARKQDGSLRLCLDFRRLNSRTVQDAYHIPRIEETLQHMAGSKWYLIFRRVIGKWRWKKRIRIRQHSMSEETWEDS